MKHNLKEELELNLLEVQAYRELESQTFNFNGYIMRNDGEYDFGSEDAYYKMKIQSLEDSLLDLRFEEKYGKIKKKKKRRLNRYATKQITQTKLKKLSLYTWWTTYHHEKENYYERCYVSGRKGYAKYCSKRRVRNNNNFALKGNSYRKLYDLWWEVF